ncbi:hypothetical protein ACFLY9_01870 [Patescibacteria group bacterium]
MTSPESTDRTIERFNRVIDGLILPGDNHIAPVARDIKSRIEKREISRSFSPRKAMTTVYFMLQHIDQGDSNIFLRLAFEIIENNLWEQNLAEVQGDFLRALCVAQQYFSGGYERRYIHVYTEALTTQKFLLDKLQLDLHFPDIDPRIEQIPDIIHTLLPHYCLLSDFGFKDFQGAVDDFLKSNEAQTLPISEIESLRKLCAYREIFIDLREFRIKEIHEKASSTNPSDNYSNLDADTRARGAAFTLLGLYLYERGIMADHPETNNAYVRLNPLFSQDHRQ